MYYFFFFFNDTATTEIYTLSLHDALPISGACAAGPAGMEGPSGQRKLLHLPRAHHAPKVDRRTQSRSEEHTSELQSRQYLVCRLLLEKKKQVTHKVRLH